MALISSLFLLMSTTCKKDYYDGDELVLLQATLNKTSETIRLGDTLKVWLTLPPTLTSVSGVVTPVSSVQHVQYSFTFYQVDIANTNVATGAITVDRIVSPRALTVSPGSLSPNSIGSVLVATARPPYQSVLNIVPPTRRVYYVDTSNGPLKVNDSYEAFLNVNFDVPDKH